MCKQEVLAQIDLRIFLRVPYATLKARREERQVSSTQLGRVALPSPPPFALS